VLVRGNVQWRQEEEGIERDQGHAHEHHEDCQAGDQGHAAQQPLRLGQQPPFPCGQQRAARPVAEQRDADGHVGEVIPEREREEPRERHL